MLCEEGNYIKDCNELTDNSGKRCDYKLFKKYIAAIQ